MKKISIYFSFQKGNRREQQGFIINKLNINSNEVHESDIVGEEVTLISLKICLFIKFFTFLTEKKTNDRKTNI